MLFRQSNVCQTREVNEVGARKILSLRFAEAADFHDSAKQTSTTRKHLSLLHRVSSSLALTARLGKKCAEAG